MGFKNCSTLKRHSVYLILSSSLFFRYNRDYVVEGEPYAGYDRHNAEVAAFHLDRCVTSVVVWYLSDLLRFHCLSPVGLAFLQDPGFQESTVGGWEIHQPANRDQTCGHRPTAEHLSHAGLVSVFQFSHNCSMMTQCFLLYLTDLCTFFFFFFLRASVFALTELLLLNTLGQQATPGNTVPSPV